MTPNKLGDISQFVKATRRKKLPVVLSKHEVSALLKELQGVQWLLASLMYGAGLRVIEDDIDFGKYGVTLRCRNARIKVLI